MDDEIETALENMEDNNNTTAECLVCRDEIDTRNQDTVERVQKEGKIAWKHTYCNKGEIR